jgi:serine/threonine-protein kinase RsbW/stage II sporulation protein AB (anti-sigma F factor)
MASTGTGLGLDASCPAHATQIAGIRRRVRDLARRCGAGPAALTRIELAVTEAATNVVLHAYRSPGGGRIHVLARLVGGCLQVCVRDDGVGMSPNPASPGLGLGLSLMAHESDRCEIRAAVGGGTEVLMRFELAGGGQSRTRACVSCHDADGAGVTA